jgi:protein-S-isoprenylcysteine O-methyltransferase Ste14
MTPPKVLPPHYFVLSLILMFGLDLFDDTELLSQPWPWIGLVPIAAGIFLAAIGARLFSRAGTNIIPFTESTALVTEGVFSFSRNPMYTGMVFALTGLAIILNGIPAWLVVVAFFAIIYFYFIKNEEALMEATFGNEYIEYRASVRRWL